MSTATRTRPEQPYLTAFEALRAGLRPDEPAWVTAQRDAAIARFAERGFPTTHDEAWRFTSLRALIAQDYALPAGDVPPLTRDDIAPYLLPDAWHLVVVNGSVNWELSQIGELPEGCGVGSLAQSLARFPAMWEAKWRREEELELSPLEALNAALWQDGVFVWLAKDVSAPAPIQILYVAHGAGEALLQVPRTMFVLEEGAQANIIQTGAGLTAGKRFTCAWTACHLGAGAVLEHAHIQRQRSGASHIGTLRTWQATGSRYHCHAITLGGALMRTQAEVTLEGSAAECDLTGLFILDGDRHADLMTTVDHAVPDTASRQLVKGILNDAAHGVFTGRVIVRPGAQGTDAQQSNPNLLLSADAVINSQPQLEIYADDVKCSHGATIGELDEAALFYLQSRGIGRTAAQAILTYAFAADCLHSLAIPSLRTQLAEVLVGELIQGDAPEELRELAAQEAAS